MGIFDFFKAKKIAPEIKAIKFAEIHSFILREQKQAAEKEIASLHLIKNEIKVLISEFEAEIPVILSLDLKERKVEDRIKLIVLENARIFAGYLEKLKISLENFNPFRLEEGINQLNRIFQDFKKKSFMSLEKARYLIGRELEAVIHSIDSFYARLNEIMADNQKLIETAIIISKIEALYNEIQISLKTENQMQFDLEKLEKIASELKKQMQALENNAIKLKTSREYLDKIKKNKDFELEKSELKKEIFSLKNLINLKELAKIHHSIPRNMKIIKEYEQNMQDAFEKDQGSSILELVTSRKEEISEKISQILAQQKKLSEFNPEKDDILAVKAEIKAVEDKIKGLNEEKSRLEKRNLQSKENTADLMAQLASELGKINLKLLD